MLGVACHKCPTRVVSRTLGVANGSQALTPHRVALVPNGEQGNGGAVEAQQVALKKLCESLVGSPLHSVVEVVTPSHGEPSHHAQDGGVSRDVHVDLVASMPELTVWVTMVRGISRVAKVVQHIPEQGGKARAVQPVATVPSVGSESGIGVVVHLSKTREK
jgi:zinc transporter ZupT